MEIYDIHTHILPGVDDGAKTMREAIQIIREEIEQGVTCIVLTPHYRIGMFEPDQEKIRRKYERLKEEVELRHLPVRLELGCEMHSHMDMIDTLETGKRPTLAGTKNVLLEFSGSSPAIYMKERCRALLNSGYQPIVAHAERYQAIRKDETLLESLVDMGVKIQLNASAVIGKEGLGTKWWCAKMIAHDLVHVIASDVHNTEKRRSYIGACVNYLSRKFDEETAEELLKPDWIFEDRN